jgi:hypothetical protein
MTLSLGDLNITIKSGVLIPVLLMIPNLVWMLVPKSDQDEQVPVPFSLTIAENAGRVAVLILPLFYSLDLNRQFSRPALIGTALALAIYYVSWIRYFLGGRSVVLLGEPLLGIPLPMAVAPTVFLVLSSYLMSSWLMLGASIVFGIAHIWVAAVSL